MTLDLKIDRFTTGIDSILARFKFSTGGRSCLTVGDDGLRIFAISGCRPAGPSAMLRWTDSQPRGQCAGPVEVFASQSSTPALPSFLKWAVESQSESARTWDRAVMSREVKVRVDVFSAFGTLMVTGPGRIHHLRLEVDSTHWHKQGADANLSLLKAVNR